MGASLETTQNNKKKFLELFKKNRCFVATTCAQVGIDQSTYHLWKSPKSAQYDPVFAAKIEQLKEEGKDSIESKLLDLINIGDTTATIFYCKTKMKDRGYVERIDNISSDGSMSQISAEDREILTRFKNETENR